MDYLPLLDWQLTRRAARSMEPGAGGCFAGRADTIHASSAQMVILFGSRPKYERTPH